MLIVGFVFLVVGIMIWMDLLGLVVWVFGLIVGILVLVNGWSYIVIVFVVCFMKI